MLTDAHCHPADLLKIFPKAEQQRRQLGVIAAASACDMEEFAHNENLAQIAKANGETALLPCFACHPQLPAARIANTEPFAQNELDDIFVTLQNLGETGRIAAIGEFGFDLYNSSFRETEDLQEKIFASHLQTALCCGLPVVLHVRRAMHKIFSASKTLSKCKAVIFHSWPGTFEEGQVLLRRGVNAYFSFGNIITLNHKQAQRSCALFPADRLLTETDAPFQPPRGENFSRWENLPLIIEKAALLRREAGINTNAKELEAQIETNFNTAFSNILPYSLCHCVSVR